MNLVNKELVHPYVILVEFEVADGAQEEFLNLVVENSRASLTNEPGCLVFDVLQTAACPTDIVLYEIYTDRAAFDLHLAAPHFHEFDAACQSLVRSKRVTELSLLTDTSAKRAV